MALTLTAMPCMHLLQPSCVLHIVQVLMVGSNALACSVLPMLCQNVLLDEQFDNIVTMWVHEAGSHEVRWGGGCSARAAVWCAWQVRQLYSRHVYGLKEFHKCAQQRLQRHHKTTYFKRKHSCALLDWHKAC